ACDQRCQLGAADVPLSVAAADLPSIEDRHSIAGAGEIGGVDQRESASGERDVEVGATLAIGAARLRNGHGLPVAKSALELIEMGEDSLSVGERREDLEGVGKAIP